MSQWVGMAEKWDVFFASLARGVSVVAASRAAGVSRRQATKRVARIPGMGIAMGRRGGLSSVPVRDGLRGGSGRLTSDERVVIMLRHREGASCAAIGRELGRDRSVIWREIRRNGDAGGYQASIAGIRAAQRARRPKRYRLEHEPLARMVMEWMDDGWSPKLISLWLAHDFSHDKRMQISHETIYQAVYVQGRGELRQDLYKCLSTGRARRVTDGHGQGRNASPYKDALKISQRPAEVADRAVPGHWEADLILSGGSSNAAIGTLVERTSRYTILLHLPYGHTAEHVAAAITTAMAGLPADLRRSLTYDRGVELARYQDIQTSLGLQVYFCDPHSPWQRGTNENTNRLLRHWFTKGSDLSVHTAEDLKRVQDKLNNRPRPTLDLDTPHHYFKQLIAQAQAA